MQELELNGNIYRIKEMNAIELCALRTQISFDDTEQATNCYNTFLERIEVRVKDDKWLPVKDKDVYYPAGIEFKLDDIMALIQYFMQYIKDVFQKSNASNMTTE